MTPNPDSFDLKRDTLLNFLAKVSKWIGKAQEGDQKEWSRISDSLKLAAEKAEGNGTSSSITKI